MDFGFSKWIGGDCLPILRHVTGTETVIARLASGVDCPSAQYNWNWAACWNPFAVVFAHEMQMRAGFITAYTCRMSDVVIAVDPLSN